MADLVQLRSDLIRLQEIPGYQRLREHFQAQVQGLRRRCKSFAPHDQAEVWDTTRRLLQAESIESVFLWVENQIEQCGKTLDKEN